MAETSLPISEVPSEIPAAPRRVPAWVRQGVAFLLVLLVLCVLWEGYKALGAATASKVPFTRINLPVRSDDRSMPHLWKIVGALFRPAQRGGADILLVL